MRPFGIVVIMIGCLLAIYAMGMSVSVETGFGSSVNNIGLMTDRQNYLLIAGVAVVAGLLMVIFGDSGDRAAANEPADPFDAIEQRRDVDRKNYAIGIGITRKNGIYKFGDASYSDLEAAISAAEASRNSPQEDIAEIKQRDKAIAADADTFIPKFFGVIAILAIAYFIFVLVKSA